MEEMQHTFIFILFLILLLFLFANIQNLFNIFANLNENNAFKEQISYTKLILRF